MSNLECDGTRVAYNSRPVELPGENSWAVWLVTYNIYCGQAGYHVILSPSIGKESLITWAGPLGCFPAQSPLNQTVKSRLISEHGEQAFFAAVSNTNESHLARLALNINEETGSINCVCNGCPKFFSFK